jgi:hypothetical protein
VELAETNRRSYLTELRLNGYTLRQLSDVLEIAPSTVMRWAPIESDGQSPSLDDPVEATHEEKSPPPHDSYDSEMSGTRR